MGKRLELTRPGLNRHLRKKAQHELYGLTELGGMPWNRFGYFRTP